MTVTFFDWQRATFPPGVAPYNTLSPNLIAVRHELETRHGGTRLGGYSVRPVRNGTDPSSHGFGAAINHRIEPRERLLQAVDWLIANHVRLGIQAIHDYVGCRIWHANRYPGKPMEAWWRPQRPNPANGMGQSWATYLHIETDRLNWSNNVPVHLRDLVNPLPPPVEPKPTVLFDPAKGVWGLYPLNKNKLTIREVTKPVTWDVTARFVNGAVTGLAKTQFTFADFELPKPRVASVLSVDDEIRLEYEFRLVPASGDRR